MKNSFSTVFILIIIILLSSGYGQIESISTDRADKYIGQVKSVYGVVVSTNYNNDSSSPMFLNLDEAYPDHIFTIFIVSSARDSFNWLPEVYYLDKKIIVTGLITEYNGKPEIIVNSPSQIKLIL